MLSALPSEEPEFYVIESSVVDLSDKSITIFRERESHYGFVGGTCEEYIRYFLWPDIDDTLWDWRLAADVKAIAGMSTVPKK